MSTNVIGNKLEEIRELLDIEAPEHQISEVEYAWYVGATGHDENGVWTDFSEQYISEGRWENGWDDRFLDEVKSMKIGDRIVIKSTSRQKNNLPFNNNGKLVGFADIKAIGTIVSNAGDGKNIQVSWTKLETPKRWYSFCGFLRDTVNLVKSSEGYTKKALLRFTFSDEAQDYTLCEEKYAIEAPESIIIDENMTIEQLGKILRKMCDEGEKSGKKVAAIYSFGLLYGNTIKDKFTASDIVKASGIEQSFDRELQKAIKLYTTIENEDFGLKFATADAIIAEHQKKDEDIEEIPENIELYGKNDFLKDVFMDESEYETLSQLLDYKKNVILQGSPGVGKTFLAKRFAYSLMGETDSSRVEFVQFHQNYSYEDFIMGYKPNEDGFILQNGVFYEFCNKAREDKRAHFFIIDEINRGNVSKIFGELMMLIENDKRGKEHVKLAYKDEMFSVPENVFIIGMMNTADRSLAIMDYALRRRFSFFEVSPAFAKDGFKNHLLGNGISGEMTTKIIEKFNSINAYIADEKSSGLGAGFRIGHSYFCSKPNCEEKKWYENIIDFEITPMLDEYWFDEKDKVNEWIGKIR